MKVGSLVSARWEDTRLGLVREVRTFPHRENTYFVRFGFGPDFAGQNRWYDETDLKLVEDDK